MEFIRAESKAIEFLEEARKMAQYEGQEFWQEVVHAIVYGLLSIAHAIKENSDEK